MLDLLSFFAGPMWQDGFKKKRKKISAMQDLVIFWVVPHVLKKKKISPVAYTIIWCWVWITYVYLSFVFLEGKQIFSLFFYFALLFYVENCNSWISIHNDHREEWSLNLKRKKCMFKKKTVTWQCWTQNQCGWLYRSIFVFATEAVSYFYTMDSLKGWPQWQCCIAL